MRLHAHTLFFFHGDTETRGETHTVSVSPVERQEEEHVKRNRRRRQRSSVLSRTNATTCHVWLAEKINQRRWCRAQGIGLSFVRNASEIPATKFVLNLLHGRHVRKQTFSCVALVVDALVVATLAVTTLTVAAAGVATTNLKPP